jgi:hypothetical protein
VTDVIPALCSGCTMKPQQEGRSFRRVTGGLFVLGALAFTTAATLLAAKGLSSVALAAKGPRHSIDAGPVRGAPEIREDWRRPREDPSQV